MTARKAGVWAVAIVVLIALPILGFVLHVLGSLVKFFVAEFAAVALVSAIVAARRRR